MPIFEEMGLTDEIFEKMMADIGSVNMRALDIYEGIEKEYNGLLAKKDGLGKEKEDVIVMMNEIEGKKKELFMKHFNVITEHFKKAFSALSAKGEAFLELEEPENPFDGGLRIKVKISGMKMLLHTTQISLSMRLKKE